jgi:hypothetical protein
VVPLNALRVTVVNKLTLRFLSSAKIRKIKRSFKIHTVLPIVLADSPLLLTIDGSAPLITSVLIRLTSDCLVA